MNAQRIAVCLESLRRPLKGALDAAAEIGARGVQFDARGQLRPDSLSQTGRRELRHMLEERGLQPVSVTFRTRRGFDIEEDLERRVDATKRVLAFAPSLGAAIVIGRIGEVPAERADRRFGLLVEVLSDIARYADHVGAVFAAETGTESPGALRGLLERIGAPAGSGSRLLAEGGGLAVNFDPANLMLCGWNAVEGVRELAAWIVHVQARDAVGTGPGRMGAGGMEVPLGRGEIDWAELLGALEEIGYGGWFTLERREGNDAAGDLANGVKYLAGF